MYGKHETGKGKNDFLQAFGVISGVVPKENALIIEKRIWRCAKIAESFLLEISPILIKSISKSQDTPFLFKYLERQHSTRFFLLHWL